MNRYLVVAALACATAEGKDDDARVIEERFELAWRNADVKLSSSRF